MWDGKPVMVSKQLKSMSRLLSDIQFQGACEEEIVCKNDGDLERQDIR
jgi:hypothetical protein